LGFFPERIRKMKKTLALALLLLLALCLVFTACGDDEEIVSIKIDAASIATEYAYGSTPDLSGLKVTVTYKDDHTETVGFDKLTVSTLDTTKVGEQTLTVQYEGFEDKITVKVSSPVITEIKIVAASVADKVKLGSTLDLTNLKVEAKYSDGTTKPVPGADITVTQPDTSAIGNATLTVKYGAFTATKTVQVFGVTSMTVNAGSVKNEIYVGETLDISDVEVIVRYSDGTDAVVGAEFLTIVNIDSATAGTKKLKITYEGFTHEYSVTVVAATEIAVNAGTYAGKVFIGGTHDTANLTALVSFSNGQKKTFSANQLNITPISTDTVGAKTLRVAYLNVYQDVVVEVVGVKSITPVQSSFKSEIIIGETFVSSGLQFAVVYTDDTTAVLGVDDVTLTGTVSSAAAGNQTLTATYLDGTATVAVKVCGPKGIDVIGLPTHVVAGEELDLTNMTVYLVYSDANETKVPVTEGVEHNKAQLNFNEEGDKTFIVKYGSYTKEIIIGTNPPVLERIEITVFGGKVGVGQTYDASNITVDAHYGNNTTRTLAASEYTVVAPSTAAAGNATLTVKLVSDATKTDTKTVSVLAITDARVAGIPDVIDFGEELDTSKVKLIVTYGEGELSAVLTVADGVTVTGYDKTVKGAQTVTVAYQHLANAITLTVTSRAVTAIDIITSLDVVRQGYGFTLPEIEVMITYSNGDTETGLAGVFGIVPSSVDNGDGSYTITVSYEGFTKSSTVTPSRVLTVKSVTALNGTIPTTLMAGTPLPYEDIRLTVIYTDGENDYVYLVDLSDPNVLFGVISMDPLTGNVSYKEFDYNTPGFKSFTIVFAPTEIKLDEITGIPSFKWSAVVTINVIGIKEITVVDGTVNKVVTVGQELDTGNLEVKVEYTDGTYTYVDTTNLDLHVSELDTATKGSKNLVITFNGFSINYPIEVREVTSGNTGLIMGASLPSSITARESYKKNFRDFEKTELPYYVGTDNPYIFRLVLLVLDDDNNIVDTTSYTSVSKVYIKDGKNWAEVGADYVTIDENKNSFHFTAKAEGKTFKIETAPAQAPQYKKEHVVEVVEGYNVTDPKELNLITNYGIDVDGYDMSLVKKDSLTLVNEFLAEHGIKRPTEIVDGKEVVKQIKGIILHDNMRIKEKDIPSRFIYTEGGEAKRGLFDWVSIYNHVYDENHKEFSMYGNYYSVYTYELPTVVKNGVANNSDAFSNSEVFRFRVNPDKHKDVVDGKIKTNELKTNVIGMAFRDNDPNSNDQAASERHMLGLTCFKVASGVYNFTQTNIEAYTISMNAEYDNLTVNLNKVKFYNAWQGHIFLYATNHIAEMLQKLDEKPGGYYYNTTVDIKDSTLAKCGGPVILAQNAYEDRACNKGNSDIGVPESGAHVTADMESDIYSYVTGQEAWFVALGQTSMAGQVLALSRLFEMYSNDAASLTSQNMIHGVDTFNLVYAVMGVGTAGFGMPGSYNGSFKRVDENGDTVMTGLDMDDAQVSGWRNTLMQAIGAADGAKAPIFKSSVGGLCWSDMAGLYGMGLPSKENVPGTDCFGGKYLTIYMLGLGIMVEYYNPTNPDVAEQ
jgi:hypothetical protein